MPVTRVRRNAKLTQRAVVRISRSFECRPSLPFSSIILCSLGLASAFLRATLDQLRKHNRKTVTASIPRFTIHKHGAFLVAEEACGYLISIYPWSIHLFNCDCHTGWYLGDPSLLRDIRFAPVDDVHWAQMAEKRGTTSLHRHCYGVKHEANEHDITI